jgi:NAD(P)-dependent dehydrogenase (short-subunit alcohol dehydrogenase family)
LVVNNAALINGNAASWHVPVDEFSELIDVNIKGLFHVLRHFLPAMVKRQRGVIVNFSSAWGRTTAPEVAPYCATKWAVEGLTRALAQELPAGMAAVTISPGTVHTQMLESCFGPAAANCQSPDEWARRAVPYLLQISAKDNGQPLTTPT